jgi:hypothetical protein
MTLPYTQLVERYLNEHPTPHAEAVRLRDFGRWATKLAEAKQITEPQTTEVANGR